MSLAAIGLIALGGFLLGEGLVWALFPAQMRRMFAEMMQVADNATLHRSGLFAVFLGVAVLVTGIKVAGG